MSDEDLQILSVGAFWCNREPGGLATGIEFRDAEHGLTFCRELRESLSECDARGNVPGALRMLASLSPRHAALTKAESSAAIFAINWLQCRGHLVPDEWNGTIFVCLYKGALLQTECNPLTMDLDAEMVGKNAVDVTDIVKASENTLDMGVSAIRATVEHARGGRRG